MNSKHILFYRCCFKKTCQSYRKLLISDTELAYLDHTSGLSIYDIETGKEKQIVSNTTFVSSIPESYYYTAWL